MLRTRIRSSHALWILTLTLGFAATTPAIAGGRSKALTGTWVTRPPASFVYQDPDGYAPGTPAPIKESSLMRWELVEDEDGLILGYNTYYSQENPGENTSRGTLCMVGARQGSRIVLTEAYAILDGEPVPDLSTIPIFEFNCESNGRKSLRCIGNGFSNLQPTALQAVLRRAKNADQLPPVPNAAREICQPGS